MKRNNAKYLAQGAIIAALYTLLTFIISSFGLSSGQFQVRISECLCILPIFTPAAVPGLFLGCVLSNVITGGTLIDIIFGSLVTLVAAILSRLLRKHPVLSFLPPILCNSFAIPCILMYSYALNIYSYWPMVLQIAVGEFISVGVLGFVLYRALKNTKIFE